MIKRVILLVIVLYLSVSAPAVAAETGTGVVAGQLVNMTESGSSVGDQDVTLKISRNGSETGEETTVADAEGRFSFDGLLTDADYSYEVNLFYQEAQYFSDTFSFSQNETAKSVEIIVYDATGSAESISVTTAHTIVYTEQGSLRITEYFLFLNDSDRTYIGSREINEEGTKETLVFPLPSDITELVFTLGLMQCCVYRSEEGFFDTMPFLPGAKEISFSYSVDTSSGEYVLSRMTNYTVSNYELLVQGTEVQVDVNQLQAEGIMDVQGEQYYHFTGQDLAPDNVINIRLAGLPQSSGGNVLLWVLLSIAVLGGISSFFYFKQKKAQPVIATGASQARQQELLVKLAQLDDDFESGNISEKDYRVQRKVTKNKLLKLTQPPNR